MVLDVRFWRGGGRSSEFSGACLENILFFNCFFLNGFQPRAACMFLRGMVSGFLRCPLDYMCYEEHR